VTRGRKPKPTETKKLEGNPGKRALNNQEPQPDVAIPECPQHLEGEARKEYKRISAILAKLKIISEIDMASLAGYCEAWGNYVQASKKVKKEGAVLYSDKGNAYLNPWKNIQTSEMDRMLRFSAEFGMTPSSRSRIKVESPTGEDEMLKYLFGKNVEVSKQ
jgi:P27 family predicted phage terminase small subunit